ncbi:sphingosine-1-phosphate phosphatase 2 [Chanos chanos]|uniref:Sphingosine-1-phosphate phosphatase 2 n=1 Tax=Chanos chanos TaxID=29144 RepID=A0A6J2VIA0_CHACN|nr:sphingosine-1-phosphate phosphatase 2 [Chanos chanos]
MSELLTYLHGSELVAGFQRACGLFPKEATYQTSTPDHLRENGSVLTRDSDGSDYRQRHNAQLQNGTISAQDNNFNYKYKVNGCNGCGVKHTEPAQYVVRNQLFYFLFLVSAALGSEVFYISFLPCIHWNLDPFLCRRLVNVWAVVMYIGQVMKDVLKLPRPLAPPVVKLEKRVDAEYGMPSTHAMAATAIAFTLLLSAQERVQFQFEVGLVLAVVVSALVGLSRLYTGMHSALDVICGFLISGLLVGMSYPFWTTFDDLQLNSLFSPVIAVVLPLFLCYTYPELDHYSTTRGDTTIILGVSAGCSVGYWVNQRLGQTFEPKGPLPVALPPLTSAGLLRGVARFVVGLGMLVLTRQTIRWASLRIVCWARGESPSDVNARRKKDIEVPYKFSTYTAIGLVNSILVNRVFLLLQLL